MPPCSPTLTIPTCTCHPRTNITITHPQRNTRFPVDERDAQWPEHISVGARGYAAYLRSVEGTHAMKQQREQDMLYVYLIELVVCEFVC